MPQQRSRRTSSKMGETAGGCAAVWCCCPCAVMHLLLLTVYRVPRGIWRRKKRRRLLKKKKKQQIANEGESSSTNNDQQKKSDFGIGRRVPYCEYSAGGEDHDGVIGDDDVDLEIEMWGRFYGPGFWRSDESSRKGDDNYD